VSLFWLLTSVPSRLLLLLSNVSSVPYRSPRSRSACSLCSSVSAANRERVSSPASRSWVWRRAEVTSLDAVTRSSSSVSCLWVVCRRAEKRSVEDVAPGVEVEMSLVRRLAKIASRSDCWAASAARLALSWARRNWLRALEYVSMHHMTYDCLAGMKYTV